MRFFIQQDLNAEVYYCENYFREDLFEKLNVEIKWKTFQVKMRGKVFDQPRDSAYIGDDKKPYMYSGFDHIPEEWTPTLTLIRNELQSFLDKFFPNHPKINAVLCNRYLSGNNTIGFHSDNEKDLCPNSFIISVSFGAQRDFILSEKETNVKTVIPLSSGSVLLMGKNCQTNYSHSIPKRMKVKDPRINLTFRCILERLKR